MMQDVVRTLLLMLLEVAMKDWRGCAAAAARRQQRSRSVADEALEDREAAADGLVAWRSMRWTFLTSLELLLRLLLDLKLLMAFLSVLQ